MCYQKTEFKKTFTVEYVLNNDKVDKNFEIDISNYKLYEEGTSKKISYDSLITGDEITVYYSNSDLKTIQYVEVKLINILDNVQILFTPAFPLESEINIFKTGYGINFSNISYVVDEGYSYTNLDEAKIGDNYYLSYNLTSVKDNMTYINGVNIYSYNPRN